MRGETGGAQVGCVLIPRFGEPHWDEKCATPREEHGHHPPEVVEDYNQRRAAAYSIRGPAKTFMGLPFASDDPVPGFRLQQRQQQQHRLGSARPASTKKKPRQSEVKGLLLRVWAPGPRRSTICCVTDLGPPTSFIEFY
jgi:hypothetical protein